MPARGVALTTSDVIRALAATYRILTDHQVDTALVGGLAVSVRGNPRLTRDVDLAIAANDDAEAESIVTVLCSHGHALLATVEQDRVGRLTAVRTRAPVGVVVDLMFASSGIEPEIVARADVLHLDDLAIPVARPEELLAMKILAWAPGREQDLLDARALIATNPHLDLDAVRADLDLIRARGFHRGEALHDKLAQVIDEVRAACEFNHSGRFPASALRYRAA